LLQWHKKQSNFGFIAAFAQIWYSLGVICNNLGVKYKTETIMCRFMYFILQALVYETYRTIAKACFAYTANQPRIQPSRVNGALKCV